MMNFFPRLFLIAFSLVLAACSSTGPDKTADWSPGKLYEEAKLELNTGNYQAALELYQKLSSRYPFGKYAKQGALDTAYAHWKNGDAGLALASLSQYNKLYPNQLGSDYALYLKGLINFNENKTLFSSFTGEDMAERDAEAGRLAFAAFKTLVEKYPSSAYVTDANRRMKFLRNVLGENEVHVARFYLRRNAFIAALNRCKVILSQYQGTPATEEALAIMFVSYNAINLRTLADDTKRILEMNFPDSYYLEFPYDPSLRGGLPKSASRKTSTTWTDFNIFDALKNILPEGLIPN